LKRNQLETLKYLSKLLVQEIIFLEQRQASLEKKIKSEKPICLLTELQRFESNMIRCALIRSMGNQTNAAKLLGLKINTLSYKIKRYKINLTNVNAARQTLITPREVTENTNGSAAVA
jgi:transcriptional regulator with GAF, ATPase, and Fis domain